MYNCTLLGRGRCSSYSTAGSLTSCPDGRVLLLDTESYLSRSICIFKEEYATWSTIKDENESEHTTSKNRAGEDGPGKDNRQSTII